MKNNLKGTKYGVVTSNKFNKQLKKAQKQGKEICKLNIYVKKLCKIFKKLLKSDEKYGKIIISTR